MRAISVFAAIVVPMLITAYPLGRRATASDIFAFQFANVMEQLQSQFYVQALSKFQASDFTAAGFKNAQNAVEQLTTIQADEATQESKLEIQLAALGAKPISGCQFNLDAALTDLPTALATARLIEQVGVSAYLGAANLVDDKVLLGTATSILTVQTRHQTVMNILAGNATVIPQAFDVALTPPEVLAITGPLISGCSLGIPVNPSLAVANTGGLKIGTALTFASSAISGDTSNLSCQMITGGMSFGFVLPFSQCVVPPGTNGPVAIFVTNSTEPLANNVVDRATKNLVAGPTIAFIDSKDDVLPSLVRQAKAI